MRDYTEDINAAAEQIAEDGGDLTLRVFAPTPTPTPTPTPWRAPASTYTDQDVVGVFLNYEEKYIDGTEIHQGDQKVLIAAKGLTLAPKLIAHIIRDGEVWKVVKLKILKPGNQAILYTLQVRQ